jgi:phage virion morphogenesis protein
MAGTFDTFVAIDDKALMRKFATLKKRAGGLSPVLKNIGEYKVEATQRLFDQQQSPEGVRWAALSDRYKKKKKGPKILTEKRYLRDSVIYRVRNGNLQIGTNLAYAAIHQFGGTIKKKERESVIHFRRGTVDQFANADDANRHVRMTNGRTLHFRTKAGAGFHRANSRAHFAMKVTIGAHEIEMPARPYLGWNQTDWSEIRAIVQDHLDMD